MLWIDSKYASMLSPQLDLFKQLKPDVWNFRCPICGDSSKDKTKCRGYFYPFKQNLRFRCHNCGASESFYKFLEERDASLFKEYKMERFKERNASNRPLQPPKPKSIHRTQKKEKSGLGFPAITDLKPNHPAVEYVINRKIPVRHYSNIFYADSMREVAEKVPGYATTRFDEYARILLPFINADGVMTHIQGRAIDDVPKSKRYITLEIEEGAPKIFGQSTLSETAPVYVLEGPIDSLFLRNCVGMGGSDIDFTIFDPENTVFVFDNERRNKEIIKRMEKAQRLGFGVCVWGKDMQQNDINDMILAGYTPNKLKRYIKEHTFRGMKAQMQIVGYKQCDTTNHYKKS